MEHVEVLRHMKETIKAIAPSEVSALDAAIAALSAPAEAQPCGCGEATCTVPWEPGCGLGKSEQHAVVEAAPPSAPVGAGGEWVLVPRDAIERAIETLENDGDEHGEGRNLRAAIDEAAAPQPPADSHCATCTCVPGMTPAVRFDTSPAEREGVVRDHLIRMGWTPPSAPVGVEEMPGLRRSLAKIVRCDEGEPVWIEPNEAAAILRALAQQPASDGGFTAADMMDAR